MLHHYISHLHAAIAGLFVALGLAVGALGLFGVPASQWWALWTALLAPLIGLAIAVPLHYCLWNGHCHPPLVIAGFLVARKSVSKVPTG